MAEYRERRQPEFFAGLMSASYAKTLPSFALTMGWKLYENRFSLSSRTTCWRSSGSKVSAETSAVLCILVWLSLVRVRWYAAS